MSKPARSVIPFERPPEPGDDLTLAQVVEQFLEYARRCKLYSADAQATRDRYLRELARDIPKTIIACRRSDLEIWLAENSERLGDWTRHSIVSMIHACLNWAVEDNQIGANPFSGVTQPEGEPRRAMTDEEFCRLLRAADRPFRQVLLFLRNSAARPGELRKLRWRHVNFERCLCELPPEENRKGNIGASKRRPRLIRLPPMLVKLLRFLARGGSKPDAHVFTNRRGRAWSKNGLSKKLLRLRHDLGIPDDCKLYGTRHAFGTGAAKAGVEMKTIAELMGHSSSKTTERYYIHLEKEDAHLQEKLEQATRRKRREG